ncbi:MAG: hypothetical protein V2A79_10820 [Planctomycetota bacterium]
MHVKGTRQLIWIPIIHSPSDLGSVGEAFRRLYIQRTSGQDWDRHIQTVDDAWERIQQAIEQMHLDYGTVRVYQDGLPQCGHEIEIVKDLAASGSRNYEILLDLVGRGATLVGTESPALLLEEYALVQQSLARLATDDADGLTDQHQELSKRVLEKRDRFIARRVDETLKAGEVGLIFLGLLHTLECFLPKDNIEMTRTAWWAATDT